MSKFGVIIQGPLISLAGQIPGNPITVFNTLETIKENYKNIKNAGGIAIVSSWKPENDEGRSIEKSLKDLNIPVILSETPKISDPDHRYKQRYGVQMGINELNKKELPNYLIKIRPDMLLPTEFWILVNKIVESKSKKLHVSEITENPMYMGDFIYIAPKDVFIDFIKCIVDYKSHILYPTIGLDDGMKYSHHKKYANFVSFFQNIYTIYLFTFREKYLYNIWNNFISNEIEIVPKEIWTKIYWRGKLMSFFVNPDKFKFDTKTVKTPGTTFKDRWFKFTVLFGNYDIYYKKKKISPLIIRVYRLFKMLKK